MATYRGVGLSGFSPDVVIHEEKFLDLITGTNTQRIECEWSHAKLFILKYVVEPLLNLQSYLDGFFRNKYGLNVFLEWLKRLNNFK